VPVARIVEDFTAMYPRWVESAATDADFEKDAEREVRASAT